MPAWLRPFLAGVLAAVAVVGATLLLTRPRHDTIEVLIATPVPGVIAVAVSGEVAQPGLYQLPTGSRVLDLLERAGGATDQADPMTPSRALLLRDEMHIHLPVRAEASTLPPTPVAVAAAEAIRPLAPSVSVPARAATAEATTSLPEDAPARDATPAPLAAPRTPDPAAPTTPIAPAAVATVATVAARPATATARPAAQPSATPRPPTPRVVVATATAAPPAIVNLNTASASELETLPGIGAALAARIVADRERNGPYRRVEDLDRVPGIGTVLVNRLRPLVAV